MSAPAPTITPELKALLRRVKLGRSLDTLPERLALAKSRSLSHGEFLELVLSDEVTRRDTTSADLRARTAGLEGSMRLENWDDSAAVSFDRAIFDELVSLRFIESAYNVLILGPSASARPFSPPLSGTLPCAVVTACTSSGPISSSTPEGFPARQQPRRRDAKAAPRGLVDPRRLLPAAARRRRYGRRL